MNEATLRVTLEILARNVVALRIARNWRQEDLARAAGMKQQRVSLIERMDDGVTLKTLDAVACALNTSIPALFNTPE